MGEKDYLGKDQRKTKDDKPKDDKPIKGAFFICGGSAPGVVVNVLRSSGVSGLLISVRFASSRHPVSMKISVKTYAKRCINMFPLFA